jgi:YD repeat-containing protein
LLPYLSPTMLFNTPTNMRVILFIITTFLTLTVVGQVNDAEAFFNGSYNRTSVHASDIKKVSVQTYINHRKTLLSVFYFDQQGFLTRQVVFDSSGKERNEFLFTYNKQGGLSERKNRDHESNKTTVTSLHKIYNGSQVIQETSSNLPFITTYLYNKQRMKIQSTTFLSSDTANSPRRVYFYAYDAKGRLKNVEDIYLANKSSDTMRVGNTDYIYDKAGNITDMIRKGKANYAFSYYKNGLLKSKTVNMGEEFGNTGIVDEYSYIFWK